MQQAFYELADYLTSRIQGQEVFLATFSGEESDFVRFNHANIRQAGSVSQRYMTVDLIRGQHHVKAAITLSGESSVDRQRLDTMLANSREQLPYVPQDPYLLYSTSVCSTEHRGTNQLSPSSQAVDAILAAGQGKDLVGLYTQGPVYAGFANSLGQRNWFGSYSFLFDYSLYLRQDKAVKSMYAGVAWRQDEFERKMRDAVDQLATLARPARTIRPGQYRVYLAPAALEEMTGMLCWGGFSMKAHRTRTTPLLKMIAEGATLNPAVTIRENTRDGLAPNFQSAGYVKPDQVLLIENGQYRDCLVSPRSAKEYDVAPNGAAGGESPESFDMAGGDMPAADVLRQLDTGLYINQLHYLNYSDRSGCRMTGMTRFATFWVENGRIESPVNVMRFDETAYRVLGENLLALTRERDLIPSTDTYGSRSTNSSRLPGALVKDFNLTL